MSIQIGNVHKWRPILCRGVQKSLQISASKCDVGNWIFSKSWEFLWFFFGILNPLGILCSLGILCGILSTIVCIFKSQLVSYISKVSWLFTFSKSANCFIIRISWFFTLLKSADFLHSKSQLITKIYLNMELTCLSRFCLNGEGRKEWREFWSLEVQEASSLHLKIVKFGR